MSGRQRRSKDQLPGFKQNVETGEMEKDTETQTGWQLDDFSEELQKDERARRALQTVRTVREDVRN